MKSFNVALLVVLTVGLLPHTAIADWSQWRGPTRDGVVADADWPAALNEQTLTQLWRVEVAEGYPGPIVYGDRVFTVESRDARDEVVRAFDRRTGEPLWVQSWPAAMRVPAFARRNGSWIKSTPACDGEHLYVIGMTDEMVCLSVEDGTVLWRVDFKERYGTNGPTFGQACSPLVYGDAVYIQAGLSVCKLDKATGDTIWRALVDEREMMGGAFSSPIITEVAGVRQLVVQTRMELCGVDLDSGDVLWRQAIQAFRGMNILTPTVIDGRDIFTATYGGGSFLLRVTRGDEGFAVQEVWRNDMEGYMSSPLVFEGHLYMHRRDQRVSCIDAASGDVVWTSDDTFGEYWSSVRSGDRILALDQDGTLMLIHASPNDGLQVIGRQTVSEQETWGHLAIVGDMIYVRELQGLAAYRWAEAE